MFIDIPVAHAQIYSTVESSSDTGGNYAGPGGSVTTGSAQSLVHVTNTNGQGSSTVYIKTEVNGAVHEETVSGGGQVDVSVKATPKQTQVEIKKGAGAVVKKIIDTAASSTAGASATASTTASTTVPVYTPGIIAKIFSWLGSLFSFFR
jgi:hypothetical protein